MFSCSKRRGSGNNEESGFLQDERLWGLEIDPSCNHQSFSDLDWLRLVKAGESLKPIAGQLLRASAELFDEFSGVIA
jgi:hypothetical protein